MKKRSAEDYRDLLISLLPPGKAWVKDPDTDLGKVLYGFAGELARVEARAFDLFNESIVTRITEMIEEYEEDFGFPEEGKELKATLAERVMDVYQKLVSRGGQSPTYFEYTAYELGYTITIEEYGPFLVGESTVNTPVGGLGNLFYYKALTETDRDVGGLSVGFNPNGFNSVSKDDKNVVTLMTRSLDALIKELNRVKPGHMQDLYDWYGPGFSRGFSWGFDSFPHDDSKLPNPGFNYGFSDGFLSQETYEGTYLTGAFSPGFNIGFDAYIGGGFSYSGFSTGFSKPS